MAQMTGTTEPQLTESEWLNEIEAQLTPPQIETVEAALNKRREWLRGVRDCWWCGQLSADLNSHPCFDAEETAIAFTFAALREQLRDATERFESEHELLAKVVAERNSLREQLAIAREALTEISVKKYEEFAFSQCVGIAKNTLRELEKTK